MVGKQSNIGLYGSPSILVLKTTEVFINLNRSYTNLFTQNSDTNRKTNRCKWSVLLNIFFKKLSLTYSF